MAGASLLALLDDIATVLDDFAVLSKALLLPGALAISHLVTLERHKIKGAIRTDFIFSAEIIVISLGIVAEAAFDTRVTVMVTIAVGALVLLVVNLAKRLRRSHANA